MLRCFGLLTQGNYSVRGVRNHTQFEVKVSGHIQGEQDSDYWYPAERKVMVYVSTESFPRKFKYQGWQP